MDKLQKKLNKRRKKIDGLDKDLFSTLNKRFKLVGEIALIKEKLKQPSHQKARWEAMLKERAKLAVALKIDKKFAMDLLKLIHKESKRIQTLKRNEEKK